MGSFERTFGRDVSGPVEDFKTMSRSRGWMLSGGFLGG